MDVWRITLAALRRWYILLPILALTGVVALRAGDSVDPEYEAVSTFMFVDGSFEGIDPEAPLKPNPLGNPEGAATVAGVILNGVETRTLIFDTYGGATYEAAGQSRSSIFSISTRARTPENAIQAGEALIARAQQDLAKRQTDAGVPETAQIVIQVLEPPAVVSVAQNGKTRIQAVVGVLGAAIGLLAAVLFDDIMGLFRRNRAAKGRRGKASVKVRRRLSADSAGQRSTADADHTVYPISDVSQSLKSDGDNHHRTTHDEPSHPEPSSDKSSYEHERGQPPTAADVEVSHRT